ncbi:aldo/keto reductase [Congzhengia minquanensis]|uniref:Aldo/keto reductase n=1 Tax=Congzhengia minquanensis TaxID=2763657 RepID=A0A926DKI9_9FIRM|nr:aldo/keto reductase [Congzhengia minquanensis]MBC8539427.1 aldo/keto reductase [Congzhengia minquanensis]
MDYITLKNSDLTVSRLCMGGCPMGGYGWGNVEEQNLIDAICAAFDSGITMFDTADTYGLGQSEITLGKGLANKRKDVVIATKFGVRVENGSTFYDNSPAWIRTAIENSLKRLGTDYIDLYQIHYRDGITPIAEVLGELENLKQEGKIRYYGLSNIHKEDISELQDYKGKFVTFQDEYSLACRKHEKDMFELSEALQLTPLTWGSLGQGILTGKYDRSSTFGRDDRRSRDTYVNFHGEKLLKNLEIVDAMKEIAGEVDKPLSAIAIRFILDYVPNSIVLAGVKNPKQLYGNCEAFDWELSADQIEKLEEISR